jgi:hypothetical protein
MVSRTTRAAAAMVLAFCASAWADSGTRRRKPNCPAAEKELLPSALEPDSMVPIFLLPGLFRPEETTAVVHAASALRYDTGPDSTDAAPTFELPLFLRGAPVQHAGAAAIWSTLLRARVEQCILPLVRRQLRCPECVLCSAILRRYKPGERLHVPPHRDTNARVTCVVELGNTSPQRSGLFMKDKDSTEDSMSLSLEPGDAVVHSFELLHGVLVECAGGGSSGKEGEKKARATGGASLAGCVRHSLVVWVHEGASQCASASPVSGVEEMIRGSAAKGVVEGQYELAKLLLQGVWGGAPNATKRGEAKQLLQAVVEAQNHSSAALALARFLRDEEGSPGEAMEWFRRSADWGHPSAIHELRSLLTQPRENTSAPAKPEHEGVHEEL